MPKTALVTGGARGIGNSIAVRLASEGYSIAVMDVADDETASAGVAKIRSAFVDGGTEVSAVYIRGSISSDDDRKAAMAEITRHFGRLDVLVNNAGVAPKVRMDMLLTTEESMDFVLDINLKGTFFMTQLAANEMIGALGKISANDSYKPLIINISSISAYTSSTQRAEYCISKAGVSMVTTLFADRLAEHGINVYEIRPGIIYTDMTAAVKEKYDRMIMEEGLTPIKRWGEPDDIAAAVSLLCSGKLGFSTGEVINVDGGFHIRRL